MTITHPAIAGFADEEAQEGRQLEAESDLYPRAIKGQILQLHRTELCQQLRESGNEFSPCPFPSNTLISAVGDPEQRNQLKAHLLGF